MIPFTVTASRPGPGWLDFDASPLDFGAPPQPVLASLTYALRAFQHQKRETYCDTYAMMTLLNVIHIEGTP